LNKGSELHVLAEVIGTLAVDDHVFGRQQFQRTDQLAIIVSEIRQAA
jgi:hypothetical protein